MPEPRQQITNEEGQSTTLVPLNIIRTETVLSRLPIHNLSKKGSVNIRITRKNDKGEIELLWRISPNRDYGEPRQLAYKLDTVVINRRIDELDKPLPKIIRFGSLRQICGDLGLDGSGDSIDRIKKALRQNAFAGITAKLTYRGRDGKERYVDISDTRYGVVFTGEKLPDGGKADAVYLILHDFYWEILNNAPIRPLDRDYLKTLSSHQPAAQRFYELVSYQIFAAIKHHHSYAKLRYSEFCTCAPQQRYYDYDHFKKQMFKIHKPHLTSGYLKSITYESTTDAEGKPDWLMLYVPGDKALAEYKTFNHKHLIKKEDESEPHLFEKKQVEAPQSPRRDQPQPQQAEELLQHFYQTFHGAKNTDPRPKEITQAIKLISDHGFEKAKYVVDFSHSAAQETNYRPQTFGGILQYTLQAVAASENAQSRKQSDEAIRNCALCCNQEGWLSYKDSQERNYSTRCPHDLKKIREFEARERVKILFLGDV